jgi:acetyltransferase-like isoleucine patch superfamily enzyme
VVRALSGREDAIGAKPGGTETVSRKLKLLFWTIIDLIFLPIHHLPGPIATRYLRPWLWKPRLRFLGKNVGIEQGVSFKNPEFISLDDNCWLDQGVVIIAGPKKRDVPKHYVANDDFPLEAGRVHIGKNVRIANYTVVWGIGGVYISDNCGISMGVGFLSFTNHYRSREDPSNREICLGARVEDHKLYRIEGPIFLGTNVGIAMNVVILPGASIGKDSFVALNSVVRGSFEENSLIAGNPGRRISERFVVDQASPPQEG